MDHTITLMHSLIDTLNQASALYYTKGESPLSDAQWDEQFKQLQALEKASGQVLPNSPTVRVGADPLSSFASHRHINRLWSMDKVQSMEGLQAWLNRAQKLHSESAQALAPLQFAVEYKLDGLTINLTYENGVLTQAATRGNGEVGESVLPQVRTIRCVPLSIPYKGILEVQGECIMRLSTLEAYNQTADEPLKNARNAAAGALRNLDPTVTAKRKLDAFFYQVGTIENAPYQDMAGMLAFLRENGFPTGECEIYTDTLEELKAAIESVEKHRETLDFLIDGAVVKICDLKTRESLGNTDKFPRWSMAYKFAAEENIATLLNVTWELGRTGKLTPLAHLSPTDIGGVTVQKATLNNIGDIERKKVVLGCDVWIRRSNDVIPEIMGRVGEATAEDLPIVPPTHCPACGQPLIMQGAHLFCVNRNDCNALSIARLSHFAQRNAMDIDGFSEKTAMLLYQAGLVRDCADLYELSMNDLLTLEGFKEKRAQNLLDALQKSLHRPLDAFVFALGIANVGRKTARDLAQYFGSLDALCKADLEKLVSIDGVGEIVATSIISFFATETNQSLLTRLLETGLTLEEIEVPTVSPFAGLTIVVTGTLKTLSRKQAEALIVQNGGSAGSSVSKNTAFLLAGEKAGSKKAKAENLGIPILTEEEFMQKLLSD